ncbi:hypothetical protein M3E18_01055 [Kocuria sp. p3-SID1433]|uniref:hypothetical protein n=1 Tax=unclassified Kocuria TaxID=2649579 RepID=UPI0021A3BDE7|nr:MULTISPECIES: hypothetical protein [unclassified Kocuria]MCT1600894.1 hypothetical protein [Kocuria sp. p3-SID1428]MCT2179145.1 hypothetical protein [Kocuria sp. p3-SID1433]
MLTRLAWNRTVPTLIASLPLAVFAVLGFRVFSVLIGGGYADPASESARAQQIVHEEVGGEANLVVLVRAPEGEQAAESAVVAAMIGALVVLPALLALIGTRIDALTIRRKGRPVRALSGPSRFWGRVGDLVYRRPILTGASVLAALVLMAAPMLSAQFSSPDDRVLREGHDARAAGDILREDFTCSSSAATVGIVSSDVQIEDLESYSVEASQIDGVDNVMAITGTYVDGGLVSPAPPGMDNQLESEDWYSLRVPGPSDGLSDQALVMNVLALSTVLGVVTPSPSGRRWTTSCS